jgi:hypothetical protein
MDTNSIAFNFHTYKYKDPNKSMNNPLMSKINIRGVVCVCLPRFFLMHGSMQLHELYFYFYFLIFTSTFFFFFNWRRLLLLIKYINKYKNNIRVTNYIAQFHLRKMYSSIFLNQAQFLYYYIYKQIV